MWHVYFIMFCWHHACLVIYSSLVMFIISSALTCLSHLFVTFPVTVCTLHSLLSVCVVVDQELQQSILRREGAVSFHYGYVSVDNVCRGIILKKSYWTIKIQSKADNVLNKSIFNNPKNLLGHPSNYSLTIIVCTTKQSLGSFI